MSEVAKPLLSHSGRRHQWWQGFKALSAKHVQAVSMTWMHVISGSLPHSSVSKVCLVGFFYTSREEARNRKETGVAGELEFRGSQRGWKALCFPCVSQQIHGL